MVAFNQQFAALATFCSLAAISSFPFPANAAVVYGRIPSSHTSPAALFHAANYRSFYENNTSKGTQHKRNMLDWSPITNVIRMADMAINSARHAYSGAPVKRNRHEAQAHFHPRDVSHQERRRTVTIPSNKGDPYILSPKGRSLHAGQSKTSKRGNSGVPGRIDIMSPTGDSDREKIGSLLIEESKDHMLYLNASEKNYTQTFLTDAPPGVSSFSMSSGKTSDTLVNLQFIYANSPDPRCATTNGEAASTEPQRITVEICFKEVQGKSVEQKSQTFSYNKKDGTIRPIWLIRQDGNKSNDPITPSKAGTAGVTNVIGGRDGTGEPGSAKNVTLVFVPDDSEAAGAEEEDATATSTMTTTITITNMSTATASASVADVEPTSTPEAPLSPSGASSNTAKSMPISTSVASAAALDVQVKGANNTSSTASLTSDSTVPTTSMAAQDVESSSTIVSATTTSDPTTPTNSVNADDVAASIAASGVSSSDTPAPTATNDTSSTVVPAAAAVEAPLASDTESSPAPTRTSVSTTPYQMMFKVDRL